MRDTGRTRLLLSLALIVALALIAIDYEHGTSSVIKTTRSTTGSAFGAAERAVGLVTRPVGRFIGGGLAALTLAGNRPRSSASWPGCRPS